MLDDKRKIGVGLTGLGFLFFFIGVLFFFDRGLLAMGNILFLAGVALTIGPQATLRFFARRKNYRGSGCFGGGVALVVWGWTFVGFALEAYGFWLLFSAFFPTVLSFLRRMPFLKRVLDLPAFKAVVNKIAPGEGEWRVYDVSRLQCGSVRVRAVGEAGWAGTREDYQCSVMTGAAGAPATPRWR
eukprot:scaffold9.g3235.t1